MFSKIFQKIIKKKKSEIFLYVLVGIVVLFFVLALFYIFNKNSPSIYVYPENPKQGDTVFVRVKSGSENMIGDFRRIFESGPSFVPAENPQLKQDLIFYKKDPAGGADYVSIFGIDADQLPGDYEISINTGETEITKEIKISVADFSVSPAALAPSEKKTGISVEKAISNIKNNDNPVLVKALSNFTPEPYFKETFSSPLSSMEKVGFSFGKFIWFAQYKLQHYGVDLKAFKDTDIHSINDGKVVLTANLSNYGKTVIIDHGLDIFSLYLHLDEFKVLEGQMVNKGQVIGLSGDTGYATAPHLHFSIRVGGARVDPLQFIETSKKIDESFFLADINAAFSNLINQPK
jgi:murein DD-endopeptidase MepM/ murein hydrolase activator NlpD